MKLDGLVNHRACFACEYRSFRADRVKGKVRVVRQRRR